MLPLPLAFPLKKLLSPLAWLSVYNNQRLRRAEPGIEVRVVGLAIW
jgi:hypothetical protein